MLDTTISYTLLSVNNLVIGLDEEKALVKAIKSSFPNSELTLSTRHLSENVARHLRCKVGVNDHQSKQII
jgi:transposase-like protein